MAATITSTPGATGSTCGCGSCGASGPSTMASYTRPRFFAGQLLTEDDLTLLEQYVVDKNRLHNRHFLGDGVVCGLGVFCDPCDPRSITVQAGHALDCCGNDIVVDCPATLDIVAMVDDLRRSLGSAYCGDPCAEGAVGQQDGATRTYYLTVRYAETLTEPIAPYATDQSCDGPCEPSRIIEGHRFELSCDRPAAYDPDSLVKAILRCVGDGPELGNQFGRAFESMRIGTALSRADQAVASEQRYAFGTDEVAQFRESMNSLQAADLDPASADDAYRVLETVRRARQYLTLATTAGQAQLDATDLTTDELAAARNLVDSRLAQVSQSAILAFTTDLDRPGAAAVLRPERQIADPHEAELVANMTKSGLVYDAAAYQASTNQLSILRDWLLVRLERSTTMTSCLLRDEVAAIRLGTTADSRLWASAYSDAALKLFQALWRYLIDCICTAFLPPCPSCDDERVLLACIQVRDCEVVDICNQVRRTVLTGTALRYWFDPMGVMRALLEYLCCELDFDIQTPDAVVVEQGPFGDLYVAPDYRLYTPPSETTGVKVGERLGMTKAGTEGLAAVTGGFQRTTDASGVSIVEAIGIQPAIRPMATAAMVRDWAQGTAGDMIETPLQRAVAAGTLSPSFLDRVEQAVFDKRVAPVVDEMDSVKSSMTVAKGQITRLRNTVNELGEQLEASESARAELLDRLGRLEERLGDGDVGDSAKKG